MISLDLIEFADLVRPHEIVDQIFIQNHWIDGSVPIEDIARAAGIKEIQYAPLNSFEGTLIANASKTEGVIVVNSNSRRQRQRFTLGHELGHFMIPRHGHSMKCSKTDLKAKPGKDVGSHIMVEAEANMFSADLLMPRVLLNKFGFFNQEPSIHNIKCGSEKLDVSFQAMAVRFADLHDYPMAFVVSRNGRVEFGYKRDDFPFWMKVGRKGDLVPPMSLTASVDASNEESEHSDECMSLLWFDENRYCELPESLIEEVYVQKDGYLATILWFEDEVEEK